MKSVLSILLSVILFSISWISLSWGQSYSDRTLLYAGFAFAGNFENRDSLYPYTSTILDKNPPGFIDDLIRAKLIKRPDIMAKLSLDKGDVKQDVTSVACALVYENVEIQKVEGKILIVILMQANVLAFNRMSNSIVASYPVRMRFTSVRDKIPSKDELMSLVAESYTSDKPQENLLDQWINKLEGATFKLGATKYLRVTDIILAPEADAIVSKSGVNPKALKNQIANLLEASLTDKSNVPIVPNTVGEAIGNKIALRFASAESLNISLPDPDYAVLFEIRGFATKRTESIATVTDIYRSKVTLSIKLPDTGKTYIEEQLYDTKYVSSPKQSAVVLSDWDQYSKSLQNLVIAIGKQLVSPEDEWLKDHAARSVEAKNAFLTVKKLFQELR